MSGVSTHFLAVSRCWIYSAPPGGAKPNLIAPGTEAVELVTGGQVLFSIDGAPEKSYGRGTIFWHRAGEYTVCRTVRNDPYRCLAIRFDVAPGEPRLCGRVGGWSSAAGMELFVADIINIFRRLSPANSALFTAYAAANLLRQMDFPPERELPAPLRTACRLIDADPGAGTDAENLAEECGVSKSYLFYLFRLHLRESPYRYRLERRLEMAKNLLLQPDLPIKSIAESCGFRNIEVFYRHFKQSEGISPGIYRRNNACF